MNVHVIQNLADVADANKEDPTGPVVTRDGAKLVSYTVESGSLLSAIGSAYITLMKALPNMKDTDTLYIMHGSMNSTLTSHKYTFVVGVTGVDDLDKRLASAMAPAPAPEPAPEPAPKLVSAEESPVSPRREVSDAEIIK